MNEPGTVCIGVDASNVRAQGVLTHLVEVLTSVEPPPMLGRVVVWSSRGTLRALPERPWIDPRPVSALEGPLVQRITWSRYRLAAAAEREGCDVLFVPGGSYLGSFRPFVAMFQNCLPFDEDSQRLYGRSVTRARWALLRSAQLRTLKRARAAIFISEHLKGLALQAARSAPDSVAVIHHGFAPQFSVDQRVHRRYADCSEEAPFRWLYVSGVHPYKHQWVVIQALAELRRRGHAVRLDLMGPIGPPRKANRRRLMQAITDCDPEGDHVRFLGAVPYPDIPAIYAAADAAVFASSCEAFGLTLLEAMGAELPLAVHRASAVPEVVGDAGLYFDRVDPRSIADAMEQLMLHVDKRRDLAAKGLERSGRYSWKVAADRTFELLLRVAGGL